MPELDTLYVERARHCGLETMKPTTRLQNLFQSTVCSYLLGGSWNPY